MGCTIPPAGRQGQVDFGDFFTYTRDWESVMDSRPDLPVFILSYEELQVNTFGKAKELAKLAPPAPKMLPRMFPASARFMSDPPDAPLRPGVGSKPLPPIIPDRLPAG